MMTQNLRVPEYSYMNTRGPLWTGFSLRPDTCVALAFHIRGREVAKMVAVLSFQKVAWL
jgi:hypothetical protein